MKGNLDLVAFIGVATALIWCFGFSAVYYGLYALVGSLIQPSWLSAIFSIAFLSLLFGAVGAFAGRLVARQFHAMVALVFLVSLLISILVTAMILGGLPGVIAQFNSYGFWSLFLGAALALKKSGSDSN